MIWKLWEINYVLRIKMADHDEVADLRKYKVKRLLFNILCLYINYCTVRYVCEHLGLFGNKPDNNELIIVLTLQVQMWLFSKM